MIRLVALDLDGTLLGGTHPHYGIREEALAALWNAHRRGVEVGIVTGRDFDFIYSTLAKHGIDPAQAAFPRVIIAEERLVFTLEGGAYQPDLAWNDPVVAAERELLPGVCELVARIFDSGLRREDPEVRRVEAEIENRRGFVEFVFSTREAALRCAELLASECRAEIPDVVPVRNGRGIALRHVRASKGAVLRRFADTAGIRPEQILAVGDSENDRSMLDGRFGFRPATVSNADESIRELVAGLGGYVAQNAYGAGVAEVIERVLGSGDPV